MGVGGGRGGSGGEWVAMSLKVFDCNFVSSKVFYNTNLIKFPKIGHILK